MLTMVRFSTHAWSGWSTSSLARIFAILSVWAPGFAQDSNTQLEKAQSKNPLQSILEAESEGSPVERDKKISTWFLEPQDQPVSSVALDAIESMRWHSGHLQIAHQWIPVSDLTPEVLSSDTAGYLKERGSEPLDLEGHRKLARWCRQHNLELQSRAHWFGVLERNPTDVECRKSLGYVLYDNQWLSPEEQVAIENKTKQDFESLKQWVPKVRDLVLLIESKDPKKRLKGIQQLKDANDPGILPALGLAIGNVSSDAALHLIGAVERFQTAEACFLLTSLALADPSNEVGLASIKGLRKYPYEWFVPDLLDLMSGEFQMNHQNTFYGNGLIKSQIVKTREMRRKYDVDQFQRRFSGGIADGNRVGVGVAPRTSLNNHPTVVFWAKYPDNQVANAISKKESLRLAKDTQSTVDRANQDIRDLQRRLATVLRATTNQKLGDEAQPWWEWWNQYEELYVSGEKYMDYSYYEDTSVSYVAPVVTYAVTDFLYKYPPLRNLISCLVAGTPIQTQSGLRPVEAIRVGDLVVAQNIQSGEIQLRPVLRTTVRPPARTYQIAYTNGEKIQATLGHRWWVIGKGWVKTKDLKEGMSMRTASGYATIESLKDADAAVTYNLLVDQDHTYFVGQSRVLSFDASEAIPTFYKVPGLAPSQLRSE